MSPKKQAWLLLTQAGQRQPVPLGTIVLQFLGSFPELGVTFPQACTEGHVFLSGSVGLDGTWNSHLLTVP